MLWKTNIPRITPVVSLGLVVLLLVLQWFGGDEDREKYDDWVLSCGRQYLLAKVWQMRSDTGSTPNVESKGNFVVQAFLKTNTQKPQYITKTQESFQEEQNFCLHS